MPDHSQRFIFEDSDVRGEIVQLEQSYQQTLKNHHYPNVITQLLGEFLVAASLLSATIKFEGTLTLQVRSEGDISLIMAEATSNNTLRGIAKINDVIADSDFQALLSNGQLCITIEPKEGKRYQGIVALEGASLAQCLESYFSQSEQLATRLWLFSDKQQAAGMLLQQLPSQQTEDETERANQWEHVTGLASTLTKKEFLQLSAEKLLHRLYHQDPVRLFATQTLQFHCSCSRTRTQKALAVISPDELESILAEQGSISINCEFCNQQYQFNRDELEPILKPTLH
jgi:molecular chaperone Hsp33